jgi:release factor glutamine methyltransferase
LAEVWTVIKILRWSTDYFVGKGVESARLDAELMLADTLGLDRVGLYVNFDRPLAHDELTNYRAKVQRRALREPVQYILGGCEFWSLELNVSPAVLIPRADTEVLVEEALSHLAGPAHLLDVGTGSGALAIALAHERPDIRVDALDCSTEALTVAASNAAKHSLQERIAFLSGDLAELPVGPYDMVVSNPPYIPTADWQELMPEVHDFEPRLALDGGADGLEAYRQLARQSAAVLKPGGWLLVEVGIDQADAVGALFVSAGLQDVGQRDDYAGIPRVVMGRAKL